MHLSELVFKKKKLFFFALFAIVVGGIISFDKISKLEDPEIIISKANVITVYPGASAHDVELKVTNILEDEFATLANILSIRSRSEANVSVVEIELDKSIPQEELQSRWELLRRKIDRAMHKLPEGVHNPIVVDDISDVYGMFYAMTADDGFSYKEMNDYADYIEKNLLKVEGVRKISVYGSQDPEISITLSPEKMSSMGVFPAQIVMAIGDQTSELYAGKLETGEQQLRVQVDSKTVTCQSLNDLLISGQNGSTFRLGDLAEIKETYNEPLSNTLYVNNQRAIGIALSMERGENIIKLGEKVDARLNELKSQVPGGIHFEKVFFQPEKVSKSISGFMWNLALSVAIVILVLMLTMGVKGGIIIGLGLLLTILATFPLLYQLDGSLQRISLGAFIVAMGMLVDNAIVVLDGILLKLGNGKRSKAAFTHTANQTALPLLGATLIAICAFLPVFLSPDTAGTYTRDLFVVLAISLTISWILSLTQVPLFSAWMLKKKRGTKTVSEEELFKKPFYSGCRTLLDWVLRNRTLTFAFFIVLLGLSMSQAKHMKRTFFPDFDYDQFYMEYNLPKGATPDAVNQDLKEISEYFLSQKEKVTMVTSSQGMTPIRYCLVRGMMNENADNYGELLVNFTDYETMLEMKPIFSAYIREHYPEATFRIRKYNLSVKASHTLEAEFSGPDPAVLKDLSKQAQQIMLNSAYVDRFTVCDDWEPAASTMIAEYDEKAARRNGTTRQDVSNAILAATDGLPIGSIYQGETVYPIKLKVRKEHGERIQDLNDIPVWNMIPSLNGLGLETVQELITGATTQEELVGSVFTSVPLSSVTKGVKMGWEESVVRRLNGIRTIQAQADYKEEYSAELAEKMMDKEMRSIELPQGYTFKWVGEGEMKNESMKNIFGFMPLSGGIILLILLLLFNDYRRPLIVVLCLPMALIGIIPGLIVTGKPFSFVAIVGVIGLSGMLIKNAIVLLDEIAIRLKTSETRYHAIMDATISRVRPVVMASVTTILGMIPLLSDPMYGSMAVAVIAGLIIGTLITLLFIPLLYCIFFRVKLHDEPKQHQKDEAQELVAEM